MWKLFIQFKISTFSIAIIAVQLEKNFSDSLIDWSKLLSVLWSRQLKELKSLLSEFKLALQKEVYCFCFLIGFQEKDKQNSSKEEIEKRIFWT